MKNKNRIHPAIFDMQSKLRQGRITRREFLYYSTLLGLSFGTASLMAGCGAAEPVSPPTASSGESDGETEPVEEVAAGQPKYGGTMNIAMQLQRIDHPARVSWVESANILRQVGEYLTILGADNITYPYLAESWEANDDVTEWTFHLRQDVVFNNGKPMTADDVIFTMGQWLDESIGSALFTQFAYIGGPQNIEKVDDYTIKLHLQQPNIGVPEHLSEYQGIILPTEFEGDFIQQPLGTGAFLLEEYSEGERATFKRNETYWRQDEYGNQLPYLDGVIFVNLDKDAAVAALQAGQVDSIFQPRVGDWQVLEQNPDVDVQSASTSKLWILRMRTDVEPWTDIRVRNALKMCQDRERILQLAYFGQGDLSIDAHIAPIHPEYCEKPIPEYDPEQAKALLAEAGFPDGITATLVTKNNEAEPSIAQALKELAIPGGFDLQLEITEPNGYWDRWDTVDLGITAWTHRPLGIMVLPLAYDADEDGNPVPWNETRWVDEEFITLLREAEGTLDIEARREIFCQMEDIMQERGGVGNSFWANVWNITRKEFKNVKAHPRDFFLLYEVWKDA